MRMIELHQTLKHLLPDARPGPAIKPVVDRGVRAKRRRAVPPAAAGLQHMKDAADDPPAIPWLNPWPVHRDQGLDHRPLIVAQPKLIGHNPIPSTEELESDPAEPDQVVIGIKHLGNGSTAREARDLTGPFAAIPLRLRKSHDAWRY
jgi:hypothetical protein